MKINKWVKINYNKKNTITIKKYNKTLVLNIGFIWALYTVHLKAKSVYIVYQ